MSAEAAPRRELGPPVTLLITITSVAATAMLMLTGPAAAQAVRAHGLEAAEFLGLSLVLQLFAVPVYRGGRVGVAAIGMLATGIVLGAPLAMAVAVVVALAHFVRARGALHRTVFDAGMMTLDAGAGAAVYHLLVRAGGGTATEVAASFCAGLVLVVVNNLLLCCAIGLDEEISPLAVWRERFSWAWMHYLAFGPLALAAVKGYEAIGVLGLVAFALPPALLLLSVRQYVARTREALDQERAAKESYRAQSEDMQSLFELTGGLAVRSHDRGAVVTFAEEQLAALLGADAVVIDSPQGNGLALETGGKLVGTLQVVDGDSFDAARWERLRPAILPQLATAIESAELVERVWRTHLEKIAALSRSMEAKDYYTGEHTERVAAIAVALARRLGFTDAELDAVEIGALLHDVGKIGIPERILNKPDALDAEEWKVMKKHPVISDHILSEVDLHPIVRQIARHSHERYDGVGYPDGVAGEAIPLAARIVLVADAVDALTTDRPYRPARHLLAALQEIREHTGSQFCPTVVTALEELFRREPQVLGVGSLRAVG